MYTWRRSSRQTTPGCPKHSTTVTALAGSSHPRDHSQRLVQARAVGGMECTVRIVPSRLSSHYRLLSGEITDPRPRAPCAYLTTEIRIVVATLIKLLVRLPKRKIHTRGAWDGDEDRGTGSWMSYCCPVPKSHDPRPQFSFNVAPPVTHFTGFRLGSRLQTHGQAIRTGYGSLARRS